MKKYLTPAILAGFFLIIASCGASATKVEPPSEDTSATKVWLSLTETMYKYRNHNCEEDFPKLWENCRISIRYELIYNEAEIHIFELDGTCDENGYFTGVRRSESKPVDSVGYQQIDLEEFENGINHGKYERIEISWRSEFHPEILEELHKNWANNEDAIIHKEFLSTVRNVSLSKGTYNRGLLHGTLSEYDVDGGLKKETVFEHGVSPEEREEFSNEYSPSKIEEIINETREYLSSPEKRLSCGNIKYGTPSVRPILDRYKTMQEGGIWEGDGGCYSLYECVYM